MQSHQADRQDTAAITAEKERTRTLARWIRTALTTLETIDPDDMEDGGDSMRSLIIDGQVLVNVVLQDGSQLVERRKVQTANHPMRRATDWPKIDGAVVATKAAPQEVETTSRKYIDLFGQAGDWFRVSAIEPPKWIGELLSVLSGHVSGVLDDEPTMPSDDQILAACEKAGLWPNTAANWVANGAFQRFFKALQESEA